MEGNTGNYNFVNKEVSWLSFNERVLQEAADKRNLLGDRIKFLGIFSSNQDEFFRVRVAMLKKLCLLDKKSKKLLNEDPDKVMTEVQKIVQSQRRRTEELYKGLMTELEKEKVFILSEDRLNSKQTNHVLNYFYEQVRPQIFPMMIDSRFDFPYLKDNSLYLAVELGRPDKKTPRYSIIEIPSRSLPRFLKLPHSENETHIILIDEIVRLGMKSIYGVHNYDSYEAFNFKITRDAELEIDEEDLSVSYLNKIIEGVKRRKEGGVIRLVYDQRMPQPLLNLLIKKNRMHKLDTLSAGGRYHKLKDLLSLPAVADLPMTRPKQPFRHAKIDQSRRIFSSIRKRDILLYFPYHTFSTVIDFIRDASMDPKVESIKITLYRVAKFSSIANALINARRNMKDVTVLLELQARFDEENNIYWAHRLKSEGVRVLFGISGLKLHSKLCMVTRAEKTGKIRYCSIGTGNFNEDTAKLYTDCCILTADQRLGEEVSNLFDFLERNIRYSGNFQHLLVSPVNARDRINSLIDFEIAEAEAGREAWIRLKINNFADKKFGTRLYQASEAGVKVQMICRSRIIIIPGVDGQSENIEAVSIVDKYLEHARFMIFCHGGEELTFTGSADLQTRNIDHRVEVTCPVYSPLLKRKLTDIFRIQWNDNFKARILDQGMSNRTRSRTGKLIRSQDEVYQYLLDNNGL